MKLLEIFEISESYRLPDAIMDALFSNNAEKIIKEVKDNVSEDIRDIFQLEQGDRKKLKQDFTPESICMIVAKLMKQGNVLDMCSGTGALSKTAAKVHDISVNEQEFSERTIPFALLDACINGLEGYISRADCLRNITIETYCLQRAGDISVPKRVDDIGRKRYDNVIMNPPYSMRFPDSEEFQILGNVIPKSKADYGFLLRGIECLKENGRLIAILPHGILFRGAKEGQIREWLIKEHFVSAVIGLPDKLFLNTSIPVCLLILEKDSQDVLFVDASRDFEKKSAQNEMTEQQIQMVVDAFFSRKDKEKYAHVASFSEIEDNDYNLNITRYVDTFEQEPLPDIHTILKELQQIDKEEQKVKKELYFLLGQLTGNMEDMETVKKHRKLLKTNKTEFQQLCLEEFM